MEELKSELESVSDEIQIMEEENSVDDDLLSEGRNAEGKMTKKVIRKRIKVISKNAEFKEEIEALQQYLKLMDKETGITSDMNSTKKLLDKRLREKFIALNEEEIKECVIENKWFTGLETLLNDEVSQLFNKLSDQIREIEDRYATPLPELSNTSNELTERVEGHLRELGFKW